MWLWILIGLNIITKVHGYGDGIFPEVCDSMLPHHTIRGTPINPQNTELPFEIVYKEGKKGEPITVTLRSNQSRMFEGFMLEAQQRGSPVGIFTLLEPARTRLLKCNGLAGTAVSHKNNQKKDEIRVNWEAPETDDTDITFRATFVENYDTFWEPMDVNYVPPPTPPSTTPSTTTSTTTLSPTTPSTTTSTTTLSPTTSSTTTSTTMLNPTTPSTTKPSTTQASTTTPSTTSTSDYDTTKPSTTQASPTTSSTTTSTTMLNPTTPSTTKPSTTQTSTTTPSTTSTSDYDTAKPSTAETSMTTQVPIMFNLLQGVAIVGMIFDSFLVVVETELSNILATTLRSRPLSFRLNKVLKILCCLLCAAVEITAVVLFCLADSIKVTLVALVCVAIVLNFIKLVILCLPFGPSHELKDICNLTVKVCSIIHVIFTTAVVVVGVLEIDKCGNTIKDSWLLKVVVASTIWISPFLLWVSVNSIQSKAILGRSQIGSQRQGDRWRKQRKMKIGAAEVIVTAVSVILIVGNLCFAVAVTVGIFRCQEM